MRMVRTNSWQKNCINCIAQSGAGFWTKLSVPASAQPVLLTRRNSQGNQNNMAVKLPAARARGVPLQLYTTFRASGTYRCCWETFLPRFRSLSSQSYQVLLCCAHRRNTELFVRLRASVRTLINGCSAYAQSHALARSSCSLCQSVSSR